jgi:hypothetical protein
MSIVTLAEAKAQLRVDGADEDTLIQSYLDAAESAAAQYLNRALYETSAGTDTTGLVMTKDVKVAVLLQVGAFYADREDMSEMPTGSRVLLNPYRIEMGV